MLNKEQIQNLSAKLEEEKARLEVLIKKLGTPPDLGDEPGFQDESEEAEEFYNQQSQAVVLKERLGDIDSVLLKIDSEEYGKCEECGEEIDYELLLIGPTIRLCREHKRSKEE
jgi:RNA polymerase-binding transcription factor DksA